MTPLEETVAAEVAKLLTGRANPRVRLLMSAGPDGVMNRMHVTIELFGRVDEDAKPCPVVAIRR